MNCYDIMGVIVEDRDDNGPEVQEVFTDFGCIIKVRLGLHNHTEEVCTNEGFIILQLCGEEKIQRELEKRLNDIEGVKAKRVSIR